MSKLAIECDKMEGDFEEIKIASGVVYLNRADEIANAISHGVGFLLSLVGVVFFWQATSELSVGLRAACLVFAASMAVVYLFSTLSHAIQEPRLRHRMRAWDQGTIYLLIAGTYSPFIWQGSPVGWTLAMMTTVWIAAAYGFFLKVLASYRINSSSTVTYLLLGWLPALVLFARTPRICSLWMVVGGVCYTFGILFLLRSERIRFSHAMWHVMVMLGSLCHGIAVYQLLTFAAAA